MAKDCVLALVEPDIHPQAVCERAAWLAALMDCRLELLLCDPEISALHHGWLLSSAAKEIAHNIREAQNDMLDDLARDCRTSGLDVSANIVERRPIFEGIMERIDSLAPRFVVKGTEHHSLAERSMFVDLDWQLIRRCHVPLYLAKEKRVEEEPTLLAAVDPTSEHDKPAALDDLIVQTSQELAAVADGELHLLHTYIRLTEIGAAAKYAVKPVELPIDKLEQSMKEEHRRGLDALAKAHGIDAAFVHQLPGRLREIMPQFCRAHGVDIAVMGGLARWGLKRAIIGTSTERVLDLLPCDVLIVRLG